jgi:exodeoxyribonuclease VII large subunit
VNRSSRTATDNEAAARKTDAQDSPYLSVTDVTRLVNDILEQEFPQLLFRGEISQITFAPSGHIYFSIKDEGAQLSCALWAGVAKSLGFKPKIGMTDRCHARPNVYSQNGRFQMIVHRMFEDGEGELRKRFLELQKRLDVEGFFAPERKRPLPFLPKAVGIVTSSTGAVIHDMMVKIRERFPSMVVYLVDTRVQGEGAAADISRAIRRLDRSNLVDVIIVARGGGSLEDLWAFNEEETVKAVFACTRPIISGVGHEVDVTLCDLAADVRAPTPTAAAEMVVPKTSDLMARVDELCRRLSDTDRWFQPRIQRVDDLSMRLQSRLVSVGNEARLRLKAAEALLNRIRPDRVLELLTLKSRLLENRLTDAVRRSQRERAKQVEEIHQRLRRSITDDEVRGLQEPVEMLWQRLSLAKTRAVEVAKERLGAIVARLEAVNPEAVLARGYSIVYTRSKHIRSINDVIRDETIDIRVSDGVISGIVRSQRSL